MELFLLRRVGRTGFGFFLLILARVGRTGFILFSDLDNFFQHVKKLLNFWNFVNIKVAKFKLDHLGFYCISYFLIGQSEKSEIETKVEY